LLIAHAADGLDELHGIQVEHVLPLGAVSEALVVAGQAQDVVDVEGGSTEDVALQGDAIAVADDHLQHRLQPHQFQADAGRQAAEAADRGLVVGDVDGVHVVLDQLGLVDDVRRVAAPRRAALGRHGQVTGAQHFPACWVCSDS
jgi:hypothetical protein